jgi:ADP-ribose pyrophosphatase
MDRDGSETPDAGVDREGADDLVWPREQTEQVGDFRHFRVRRDWNRSPQDGDLRDFYVLEMPDWVQVVAVTPGGRLVLVEQFRQGVRRVTLEFPAGLVEPGEDPVVAAARELEEETGYRGGEGVVIGEMDPNTALQSNRLFIVLIEGCCASGTRDPDPSEVIRTREVEAAELDALIAASEFKDAYGTVAWDRYRRYRSEADAE